MFKLIKTLFWYWCQSIFMVHYPALLLTHAIQFDTVFRYSNIFICHEMKVAHKPYSCILFENKHCYTLSFLKMPKKKT